MSTSTLRWQRMIAVLVTAIMVMALVSPITAEARTGPNLPTGAIPAVRLAPVRQSVSPALADIPVRNTAPGTDTPNASGPYVEKKGGLQIPRGNTGNAPQVDRPVTPPDKIIYDDPMPSVDASWNGIGQSSNRTIFGFGVYPPDTNGDSSMTHYIETVNLTFSIWDYTQTSIFGTWPKNVYAPQPTNILFTGFGGACENTDDGDPVVLYDEHADRWLISQFALPNFPEGPFSQCIAISTTGNPLGAWYRYEYQFDKMNDYPKIGIWQDAYYLTFNQFMPTTLGWGGQGVVALDRTTMLAGGAAIAYYWDLYSYDPTLGGMLPADNDGFWAPPGTPGYVMQVDDDAWGYSPDQLQMWGVHVNWFNPAGTYMYNVTNLGVSPFDSDMCGYARSCIPQPDTTQGVDAISDRLMYRLQYRNFGTYQTMVVNHTVDVDGTDHAGIRWYELRRATAGWFVRQQGNYAPDASHRWMGSIAMDASGNMALGFSVSDGTATYPSIRYVGRKASDPLNTLPYTEGEIWTGGGSQTASGARWGDYSSMSVLPDGCTFVYAQEYLRGTTPAEWYTFMGMFDFNTNCNPVSTSDFRSVGTYDGYVTEKTETANIGASYNNTGAIQVGDDSYDRQMKGILSFNTAAIPNTAVITNARIELRYEGKSGTSPFATHGALRLDVANPSFGTVGLLASDFQAAATSANVGLCGNLPIAGWYACKVKTTGINVTGTTQYRVYFTMDDNDDHGNDWVKFTSGNASLTALRPVLIVEYYIP